MSRWFEFTEKEREQIMLLSLLCTIFSVTGSLFIIFSYLKFSRLRAFAFQLIVCLALADLLSALAWWIKPDETIPEDLCIFQAFWLNFSKMAMNCWVACIAHMIQTSLLKDRSYEATRELMPKLRCRYHFFSWTFPLAVSAIPLATKSYESVDINAPDGPQSPPLWCWIKSYTLAGNIERIACFYGPAWIIFIYVLWVYCRTWNLLRTAPVGISDSRKALNKTKQGSKKKKTWWGKTQVVHRVTSSQEWFFNEPADSEASFTTNSLDYQQSTEDMPVPKHKLVTQSRIFVYPFAFMILLILQTLDRFYELVTEERSLVLCILNCFATRITGFVHAVIYGLTSAVWHEWTDCCCSFFARGCRRPSLPASPPHPSSHPYALMAESETLGEMDLRTEYVAEGAGQPGKSPLYRNQFPDSVGASLNSDSRFSKMPDLPESGTRSSGKLAALGEQTINITDSGERRGRAEAPRQVTVVNTPKNYTNMLETGTNDQLGPPQAQSPSVENRKPSFGEVDSSDVPPKG